MTRDPSGFSIVNLQCSDRSRADSLDILLISDKSVDSGSYEKVYVVCRGMENGEQEKHVRRLSMKPKILV